LDDDLYSQRLFNLMDLSNNGRIDLVEFLGALRMTRA
jgi:Ca2+-binding EF-hand superfamily protein